VPDLAVIVPTRGRPDNVRKVIGAWDFTNAWDHADLVPVVDADDPEIQRYRELVADTEHPDTGEALVQLLEVPRWMPMVHKLDLAARELAGRYWALGFAGDDHLPQTINWAQRYLTVLRELGTGMVYGDDGYQGAKLSTEWAVTSDAVRALDRMVPAPVEHMYCDNSILELFTLAGAVRHLPEVRIEHMHPYAGKADSDEQYKRVNGREQMHRDRVAYQKWRAKEAPAQVTTIRALRRGRAEHRPVRAAGRQGRMGSMKPPRFFKRVRGATPEDIMMALADFAAQVPAGQEIVEIGVFHGRTALQMAWGARQGNGAHVTAIDPWDLPGNTYDPPFTDSGTRRWAFHHVKTLGYARSITLVQAFSVDAAMTYDGPPIGLLFIDGDHSEEGATRDIEIWAPHLAPDARIAVDDYGHPDWPGVKTAVDRLVDDGFLEPVEIYHDRLAVTRLAPLGEPEKATAITSEGVYPSPEPPTSDEVLAMFDGLEEHFEEPGEAIRCVHGATECCSEKPSDTSVSSLHEPERTVVVEGELPGVAAGTSIEDLTIAQMKILARNRGITLGARKDKRSEIIEALRLGR
jgi:predicted O-methyltransferase YrrM